MMNEESLNIFIDSVDDFVRKNFSEQVKLLVYYFQMNEKKAEVLSSDISNAYSILNIIPPQNISDVLKKNTKSAFIKKQKGYVLQRQVKKELDDLFGKTPIVKDINDNLRLLLPKIKDNDNKEFLREAIDCLEIKAYRSAIIMSWLLVIHNLYSFIIKNKKNDFDTELLKKNFKLKQINSISDFSELKESIFIEIARAAGILTNDQRKILDEKLGIRNTCAHPNQVLIREAKAVNFIEDLIENIYLKFI